ncbi:MAG: hypothetical protein OEY11_06170 [Gammaproteobacteria bacterium]|nr:hypothetical protein [Gammaproteobacteria bacterium]
MRLIPEQSPPSELPSHYDLGKTDAEIIFNNAAANRNAAISMIRQGHLSVSLYTQDLDPQVLDNENIAKYLLEMAKHYQQMQIRILVRDSTLAVKNSHVLLRLAQQLSSHIEVKTIPDVYREVRASFMVVDRKGLYYRPKASEFIGSVNFNSPARAVKLLEFFSEVWEKAVPDPHFRKLHI